MSRHRIVVRAALITIVAQLAACAPAVRTPSPIDVDSSFAGPFPVAITDYDDHAMEPFLTRDGRHLLFNNRNAPAESTDLHLASRVNDSTFAYRGPLTALNSGTLDAVPAVASDGTVYFVSLRAYDATHATIFRSALLGDSARAPTRVPEIATEGRGLLDFDVDVSSDGRSLIVARGRFAGGELPLQADLHHYTLDGGRWRAAPADDETFAAINTRALEYAPAVSADGLELCFTRLEREGEPMLMIARRPRVTEPWGRPSRIAGPTRVAEAATWSADARTLLYHARVGERYVLRRLTR